MTVFIRTFAMLTNSLSRNEEDYYLIYLNVAYGNECFCR